MSGASGFENGAFGVAGVRRSRLGGLEDDAALSAPGRAKAGYTSARQLRRVGLRHQVST
ncbi:hypothetical protein [Streptomyces tendae]|uniref:hypothetical protein n=1 Tax=Streptomyces tendae TaxID=1932 RepID=UPI0036BADA10